MRDEPGWVTFSIDGQYAYPSTGDVIDTHTRKIVASLKDEMGRDVQSEKMVEIDFKGNEPVQAGDQFGLGRVVHTAASGSVPTSRGGLQSMSTLRARAVAPAS